MALGGAALAGILNHLIAQAPGATARLAPHAGRRVAIDAGVERVVFEIGQDGQLAASEAAEVDATIRLTPDAASRLPFEGRAALRGVPTEGDADLLAAFNDVFQQLRWDAEADLAKVFGPVVGFRLAEAGRSFAGWLVEATRDTAKALAEYVTEESAMLATSAQVHRFNADVDTLRDDIARLEARLSRLESGLPE